MANGSARFVPLLLALAVGTGCSTIPGQTRSPGPIHTTIRVGPRASDLTIDRLTLDRSSRDLASWVASEPGKKLYIEFTEQPFLNMQRQPNGRFRVRCSGHSCFSGDIQPQTAAREYKYFQILEDANGTRDEVDGIIVIVP